MSITEVKQSVPYDPYYTESTPAQPLLRAKKKASDAWTEQFPDYNEIAPDEAFLIKMTPKTVLYRKYCTKSTPAQRLVCAKEKASAAWTKMFPDNELFSWIMFPENAEKDAKFLKQLPIPIHVTMFDTPWSYQELQCLTTIANLQSLSVPGAVNHNNLRVLKNNFHLTDLDLSNNVLRLEITNVRQLLENRRQKENRRQQWTSLDWVKTIPHLQALKLPSFVNDAYVAHLVTTLRNQERSLQSLSLKNCKDVTDQSIPLLTTLCPTLKYLDLSGTGVTDLGVNSSTPLWNIPKLDLSECLGITPLNESRNDTLNVETFGCGRQLKFVTFDEDADSWGALTYKNAAIQAEYEAGRLQAPKHDIKWINIYVLDE